MAFAQKTCRLMATIAVVVSALCLAWPQDARSATASEMFADGNRLFREELYWAALLRYSQASEAGMDTPVLHYDMGVAHYKARQYARARESLLKSSRYEPLRPISHYNLGLAAFADGDIDEALGWFRRARDQAEGTSAAWHGRR